MIYIVGNTGSNPYAAYEGDFIARYTIDGLYKTEKEIISGEGKIELSENSAFEGEEVTLNVTPKKGYSLLRFSVLTVDGETVEVNDNKFIMPAKKVIVQAEFVKDETENPSEENPKDDDKKDASNEVENPNTSSGYPIVILIVLSVGMVVYNKYFKKVLR